MWINLLLLLLFHANVKSQRFSNKNLSLTSQSCFSWPKVTNWWIWFSWGRNHFKFISMGLLAWDFILKFGSSVDHYKSKSEHGNLVDPLNRRWSLSDRAHLPCRQYTYRFMDRTQHHITLLVLTTNDGKNKLLASFSYLNGDQNFRMPTREIIVLEVLQNVILSKKKIYQSAKHLKQEWFLRLNSTQGENKINNERLPHLSFAADI